jgi:hypothetical protein
MSGDLRLTRLNDQGFGKIRLPRGQGADVRVRLDGGGADLRLESLSGSIHVRTR